ncbi:hypothetical protein [Streptomyces noursei]|uniref:hypothetical protein n=1 Tax=Streptomyces noursei TaxID=1971 RepID=UPI0011AED732|nr:hypothetical protein [Streptomyces noursei]
MNATDAFRKGSVGHPPVVVIERDPDAREAPRVRVAMRPYDDDFAATVPRTLRASYPDAPTLPQALSCVRAGAAPAVTGRTVDALRDTGPTAPASGAAPFGFR